MLRWLSSCSFQKNNHVNDTFPPLGEGYLREEEENASSSSPDHSLIVLWETGREVKCAGFYRMKTKPLRIEISLVGASQNSFEIIPNLRRVEERQSLKAGDCW